MQAQTRLSGCGHNRMWNGRSWQTMAENSHGLVLLQHGSFFDGRMSISRSAVLVNQSSVLQSSWTTLSSIGLKQIKAALD